MKPGLTTKMQCKRNIKLSLLIIVLGLISIVPHLPNNILSLNGVFSSNNVSALSYQSNIGLNFTINPSLSISVSSNDLVIPSLIAGSYDDSNSINVVVGSNTLSGYTVSANTSNEEMSDSSMSGSSSHIFSSLSTEADLEDLSTADDNTWGYSYSLDSGSSWSNYSGLSTSSNRVLYDTNSSADNKTIGFKIGAKASSDQPSGVYTTTINFMAVSKVTPNSLLDAYRNEHKTMVNGYYTMQDMTNTICANTDIYDEQLQVIDIRDKKLYWISKLRDDNCWMTQNLDLDLETTPTNVLPLTSDNTDLNLYGSMGYTASNGYSCSNPDDPEATLTNDCSGEDEVITWAPARATIPPGELSSETWGNSSVIYPYSYDSGQQAPDGLKDGHGYVGNHYNWPAAVASNSANDGIVDIALNSICPANWRLPNASSVEGGYEFSKLFYAYGVTKDDQNTNGYAAGLSSFNKLLDSPLYYVRGGGIDSTGLYRYKVNGYYYSSVKRGGSYAYYLDFSSSSIKLSEYNYRSWGYSLRCLAK